jgi:DNA-directed RNA polymerase specialized sigma24 family protein
MTHVLMTVSALDPDAPAIDVQWRSNESHPSLPQSPNSLMALIEHLDDLYPLARVLAGEAKADDLIAETFRRAAQTPPAERPDDLRGWLVGLLMEVRSERGDGDTDRGPGDPFGREAARKAAERTLPVAFAACSAQERALLTLDVLHGATAAEMAGALDVPVDEARERRDEARSSLRAALRDSLTGPERMLVDVALREEELREALREVLTHRFHPAPPNLQAEIASVIEDADASDPERDAAPEEEDNEEASAASTAGYIEERTQVQERTRRRRSRPLQTPSFDLAGGVLGVFLIVTLALGGYVTSVLLSPAPSSGPPQQSLTAFAAENAASADLALSSPDTAEVTRFLADTYDRRLALPRIDRTVLAGAGTVAVDGGPSVPAIVYRDTTRGSARITALAFTYASLDALDDRAPLDTNVRKALEREGRITARRTASHTVLYWRHRDDVFVLVAEGVEADSLAERVR